LLAADTDIPQLIGTQFQQGLAGNPAVTKYTPARQVGRAAHLYGSRLLVLQFLAAQYQAYIAYPVHFPTPLSLLSCGIHDDGPDKSITDPKIHNYLHTEGAHSRLNPVFWRYLYWSTELISIESTP
jgi:hypothetical protein